MESAPAQLSDYQIQGELGRGSYGVVYRVLNTRDNQIYVLKKINISHLSSKHQHDAFKEIQILRQLNHPHIIKYFNSFIEDSTVNIIMEYAESGDMHRLLKVQREKQKHFSEKELWRYAFELSTAIAYLHEHNIIHRDIKCMNVFLNKDKRVKLGDLGASKITGAMAMQQTRVGTPLYLAPELVRQAPYDFKVDVWAMGCVMYLLAALEAPFQGDNLIALGTAIVNKKPKPIPSSYSPKLSSFIMRLLEKRPKDRPTITEALMLIPSNTRLKLESVGSMEDLSTNFTLNKEEPMPQIEPPPAAEEREEQKISIKPPPPVAVEVKEQVEKPEIVSLRSEKAAKPPLPKSPPREAEMPSFGRGKQCSPDPVPMIKEDISVKEEPVPSLPPKPTRRPQTASAARFPTPRKQVRMRITVRNLQESSDSRPPLLSPQPPVPKLSESTTEPKISHPQPIDVIEPKAPMFDFGQKVTEDEKVVLRKIFDAKRPSTAVARVRITEEKKQKDEQSELSFSKLAPTQPSARPMSAAPKSLKLNPLFKPPKLQSLLHPSACTFLGTRVHSTTSAKKKFSVSDLNNS